MKKILDVNKQRKIRDKNKRNRYFKILIFMLFFFVTMVFVWRFSINRNIFVEDKVNFPIFFSGDDVLNFEKTRNGFSILTTTQLTFYNNSGEKIKDVLSNNSKMQFNICELYILSYEKGSKNFSVYSNNRLLFSGSSKNNIKFGKIYKNGIFALVTDSESSFCELVVYNAKGEQIFGWNSAESLLIDFDFTEKARGCVLTSMGVEKGLIKTSIYEVNFDSNNEILKKDFNKYIPLSIKKNGSVIILVCDTKTFFVDSQANIINKIEYGNNIKKFVLTDLGYLILALEDKYNFRNVVVTYDKFGSVLNKLTLEGDVKKIKNSGKDILIFEDNFIIHTNINLNIISKIEIKEFIEDYIYIKPYLYYASMNKIERVNID